MSAGELFVRSECQGQLALLVRERAAYWKQRGKFKAIREGDANTAFHHAHATERMRRNQIKTVEVDSVTLTSHEAKTSTLTQHFASIMGTQNMVHWQFDLNHLYPEATPLDNSRLTAEFSAAEALTAVRAMNRDSAPGADGHEPSSNVS